MIMNFFWIIDKEGGKKEWEEKQRGGEQREEMGSLSYFQMTCPLNKGLFIQ